MGDKEEERWKPCPTSIRYGLAAIKNVGQGAMEAAIRERDHGGEFTSLEDFCARLDSRVANRKMLESLVKAGAFDFLERDRAELVACIEDSLAAAAESHKDRASGQVSLFDDLPVAAPPRAGARAVTSWTQHETMTFEKELLGFYVTGHPLDAYAGGIAAGNYQTIVSLGELEDRATFRIAGAIATVEKKFTKKEGKPFAVVWLEDLSGTLEVVIWNEVYVKVIDSLVPGRVIAIQGTLDKRDDTVRATAQKVKVLAPDSAQENGSSEVEPAEPPDAIGAMVLRFPPGTTATELQDVKQILRESPGFLGVRMMFERANGETVRLDAGNDLRVAPSAELKEKLARWL
ncbi:MAG: OB-fold nucleic acid binding domain-containing protein [Chthoniobacterales bacterium]